jgi:hypothetical protein
VNDLTLRTPLRDLLTIPEKVDASDYVLRLHEGVAQADRTVADYVVTDSIAASLDDALGLVERTLAEGKAKGTFIHGSFGSGKSHFMAVLHLLLTGNVPARQLPGLQQVVARRSGVFDRNLLAIDYHLLGAESFEQALFKGYLDTVRAKHPDRPLPVLHASDALFADAQKTRELMAEERFFAAINQGNDDGWGELDTAWDASSFDAALRLPAGHPDRADLAQTLMSTLFTGYQQSGAWLDITDGLKAMTEHARDLGYDGILLFLDELVLWLGQHLSDTKFIQSETSKVAKLVETGLSSLPIPMISFVARQRDLKAFLGGGGVGAEQEALGQSFQWWEDRFEKIELKAADLPKIVKQRLLTPVSVEAGSVLRQALDIVKQDSSAWGYLLTDEAGSTERDFADVYPFSPALVDALVALSSLMQRERTALKLMGELLAAGRSVLTASDVIPVGDLFDPVVLGTVKPLTEDMRKHFAVAGDFYRNKMRPYLLGKHRLSEHDVDAQPRTHAFHTEDRLVKTLLLAELVPETTSLRNLTAARLAALNYGTINAYVPGAEAQQVVTWAKQWAQEFGEVSLSASADPIIAIRLAGVDYSSILERVQAEDTLANRRELIRAIITEELGLDGGGLVRERTLTWIWRGHKRDVSVLFGNVRDTAEVRDDDLIADPDTWRLVIDFPYDDDTHSPTDDIARLNVLKGNGVESATIAWIPNFLHSDRLNDIGKLVTLEYVLKPAQFDQNAAHLSVADKAPARNALENQRAALRSRVHDVLRQAYGVSAPKGDDIDRQLDGNEVFSTLFPGLSIQPPVAVTMKDGIQAVLDQAWTSQYPDHPQIEPGFTEVRVTEVRAALELVARAQVQGGRLQGLDGASQKLLRRIAVPLRLGTLRENVFAVSPAAFGWRDDFVRWSSGLPAGVIVGALRGELDRWGMSPVMEDAVLITWALLSDREWVRGTAIIDAPPAGTLTPDLILRAANLPSEQHWTMAVSRAQTLFGIPPEPNLVSAAVRRLGQSIANAATRWNVDAAPLVTELEAHSNSLAIDRDAPLGRLATARRARDLLGDIVKERDPLIIVEVLAAAALPDEAQNVARSIATAGDISRALHGADWNAISTSAVFEDSAFDAAMAALRAAAAVDELHAPLLAPFMTAAKEAQGALIRRVQIQPPGPTPEPTPGPTPDPSPDPTPDPTPGTTPGQTPVEVDDVELDLGDALEQRLSDVMASIRAKLAKNPGKRVHVSWWLE